MAITYLQAASACVTAYFAFEKMPAGGQRDSAKLCWEDACKCLERDEDFKYAVQRAMKSLAHSVGIASPKYAQVKAVLEGAQ